jgi:hypothetical protein
VKNADFIDNFFANTKVPTMMNRKPYNLVEWSKWKSSEVKIFLLYYAVPVLLNYTPANYFNLFGSYMVALRLLYEPSIEIDRKIAHTIFEKYIERLGHYFGETAYDYTIHAHIHLADQVQQHGPLHASSLFCFEV